MNEPKRIADQEAEFAKAADPAELEPYEEAAERMGLEGTGVELASGKRQVTVADVRAHEIVRKVKP